MAKRKVKSSPGRKPRKRTHMNPQDFYLRVARALEGCQLVEQTLKLYISEALELVRRRVAGSLPFSMSGDDFADAPLGQLIKTFRKLTINQRLVADLNKFTEERNFLSHRAITFCLDPGGDLDNLAMAEIEERLGLVGPEAERLCIAIHEEANKFRGELLFGQ
jgi:hypothetical protein